MGPPQATRSSRVREQAGVDASDLQVVLLDWNGRENSFDEGGTAPPVPRIGELDSNQQLGRGDGGNRDVVLVVDQTLDGVAHALGSDKNRRVENQPFQERSSTPRRARIAWRSWAQLASGGFARRIAFTLFPSAPAAGPMRATGRPRRRTTKVSPRFSTASSSSENLRAASVAVKLRTTTQIIRLLSIQGAGSSLAPVSEPDTKPVAVIGAALDLGQGRRGVDMGPSAIRYAGLESRLEQLGRGCIDWGNVGTAVPEAVSVGDERVRYLPEIKATCAHIADLVSDALDQGLLPLVLGGDHTVALGTLGGLARKQGPGGVLWIDAHGDLNRPGTSPTGNVHGMVLAAALGLAGPQFESDAWSLPAVESTRVALVGVRSLDDGERELLSRIDARVFTMSDIDRIGVEKAIRASLEHIRGPGFVHISLDMDSIDPDVAPGVGTPVRGGLSYREAHFALELVAESGLAGSLEVVEVNPILDRENDTARLAVELVASALGATIL